MKSPKSKWKILVLLIMLVGMNINMAAAGSMQKEKTDMLGTIKDAMKQMGLPYNEADTKKEVDAMPKEDIDEILVKTRKLEKVKKSMMSMPEQKERKKELSIMLSRDIDMVLMGINGYRNKYGGFPHNEQACSISSKTNCGVGEWNESNFYVSKEVGSRWTYKTVEQSETYGSTVGYVVVSPKVKALGPLSRSDIANVLRTKCLNGQTGGESLPVKRISEEGALECLLAVNTVLHKK